MSTQPLTKGDHCRVKNRQANEWKRGIFDRKEHGLFFVSTTEGAEPIPFTYCIAGWNEKNEEKL